MKRIFAVSALFVSMLGGNTAQAALFLDLTSVTPGTSGTGTFLGTLGGITVTGSISGPAGFFFNATGPGIGDSTIDGSSPQFSYSTVFSPTVSLTDRVGFTDAVPVTKFVTMTFSSPVTDPVFHVANLDWAGFGFSATGLTTLTLLNGNNGLDGDGIDPTFGGAPYSFLLVHDANFSTSDSTAPFIAPPTSGLRSAYASVQLNGTFSTIGFAVDSGPFSDSGSFTISIVPEPGSLMLTGLGALGMTGFTRRRRRKAQGPALPVGY